VNLRLDGVDTDELVERALASVDGSSGDSPADSALPPDR